MDTEAPARWRAALDARAADAHTTRVRDALTHDLGQENKSTSFIRTTNTLDFARLLPRNDGRRIRIGVSTNQRLGKPGAFEIWWPKSDGAIFRLQQMDELPELPKLEWAAIWQIELMREAPNISIEDLDVENLPKALRDMRKMSSGGHRATIAIAGDYVSEAARDDLALFDDTLQDKLQQLFALLWLNRISEIYNVDIATLIAKSEWKSAERLSHISAMLGAVPLFWGQYDSAKYQRKCRLAELASGFLETLDELPKQQTLSHEVMLGLYLPQMTGEHSWIYIPDGEKKASVFQRLMTDVFSPFDMVSLSGLQGTGKMTSEVKGTMTHLGGQRNRLNEAANQHYANLASLVAG